jgi:hypothetical protein
LNTDVSRLGGKEGSEELQSPVERLTPPRAAQFLEAQLQTGLKPYEQDIDLVLVNQNLNCSCARPKEQQFYGEILPERKLNN